MTPEKVANGNCHNCGERVAVKKNRAGLAYYRCDDCGIEVRHHLHRVSDKYLQSLGVVAGEKPEKPGPAAAPAAPVKTGEPPKPKGLMASLLSIDGDE